MKIKSAGLAFALSVLLPACSTASDDPQAVTPDEAQQLNDAAAMLDANSVSADALDANSEGQP